MLRGKTPLLLPPGKTRMILFVAVLSLYCNSIWAFSPTAISSIPLSTTKSTGRTTAPLPYRIVEKQQNEFASFTMFMAGGFEWEDPTKTFDQGVENPFKNPDLIKNAEDSNMKFDPARLLGPRLNGVNLYLIGMMGTGKSSVGDIVARREYFLKIIGIVGCSVFAKISQT
jgi:hypothetical protein